jgi:hypothetical protein
MVLVLRKGWDGTLVGVRDIRCSITTASVLLNQTRGILMQLPEPGSESGEGGKTNIDNLLCAILLYHAFGNALTMAQSLAEIKISATVQLMRPILHQTRTKPSRFGRITISIPYSPCIRTSVTLACGNRDNVDRVTAGPWYVLLPRWGSSPVTAAWYLKAKFRTNAMARPIVTMNGPMGLSKSFPLRSVINFVRHM